MSTLDEVMAWDRLDPYYVWAEATGYAGMPLRDHKWVPLLVETDSPRAANELKSMLASEFAGKLLIPWEVSDVQRFTVHVFAQVLAEVLKKLTSAKARWELGLPFASRDSIQKMDEGFERRPKSKKQVIGFIDYGCAFAHQQFRVWENGKRTTATRVLALWDQGGDAAKNRRPAILASKKPPCWTPPPDFGYGAELNRGRCGLSGPWEKFVSQSSVQTIKGLPLASYLQQFATAGRLDEENCYRLSGYQAVQAPVTHGTHMMDVAAGYPNPLLGNSAKDDEPKNQDIVFVQLPRFFSGEQVSGLLRTHVLDAVNYIFSCAADDVPVTINLSYGAYTGPHDGSSILEMALDEVIVKRRASGGPTDIVIAAGNGAAAQVHAARSLKSNGTTSFVWSNIPDNPTDQFTEVWLTDEDAANPCKIRFIPPGVQPATVAWVSPGQHQTVSRNGQPIAMVVAPKAVCQSDRGRMVLIAVAPTVDSKHRLAAPYGDWTIEIHNPGSAVVTVDAWTERDDPVFGTGSGPRQARFHKQDATSVGTLNSLAHGRETIVVGGYVGGTLRVPEYSSSGPGRGLAASRNHLLHSGTGKAGPEWLAVCEESEVLPGIAAAAVIGNERVRLPGTSVAAAVATRYVVKLREVGTTAAGVSPIPAPPAKSTHQGDVSKSVSTPCVPIP